MILRPYQVRAIDELWAWWHKHPDAGNPIVEASVGAGKSLLIAAIAKRMDYEWPGSRSLVLVHQKELAEQNLDKFHRIAPDMSAGVYSAALGRKELGRQVTFATIGSIYKHAHRVGNIGMVMTDECHLINPKQAGMWRQFLMELGRYCPGTRTVGFTGTPFRGNGVFLTAGDDALFNGVATRVTMKELLRDGYLAPLTPVKTETRIETEDVSVSGSDYVVSELAKVSDTERLVEAAADEIVRLAAERKRWLVFAVTVAHAEHVAAALRSRGVAAEMVCGETPQAERDRKIEAFRRGELRCLVNVAVLTTGFDVPEVDFIANLRASRSPVLYVQIAGRGMRTAEGKTDCLWADFTDTTQRLGPVDEVKGRPPSARGKSEAPFRICPQCGSQAPTAARECIDCGHQFPEPERIAHGAGASGAAVLSSQASPIKEVPIDRTIYATHVKPDRPDSMRVEYWSGPTCVAKEWVHLSATGYPRLKAEKWWRDRALGLAPGAIPANTADGLAAANAGALRAPKAITIDTREKYPGVLAHRWTLREGA